MLQHEISIFLYHFQLSHDILADWGTVKLWKNVNEAGVSKNLFADWGSPIVLFQITILSFCLDGLNIKYQAQAFHKEFDCWGRVPQTF
jgi:hypothetical protein